MAMPPTIAQRMIFATPVLHYIGDTLAYLRLNFVNEQDRYFGEPLKVLLKDLVIPVRSYLMEPSFRDRFHLAGVGIAFIPKNELDAAITKREPPLMIHIQFANKVSADSAVVLLRRDHIQWLAAEERFYGEGIIQGMVLPDYSRRHLSVPLLRADTTGYLYIDRFSTLMQGKDDGQKGSAAGAHYPDDIDAFIAALHNDAAKFETVTVQSKIIVMDAGGPPSGNLLRPLSLDIGQVKKRYPNLLLMGKLVRQLDDEERDYYADLLLYSLVGMSTTDFPKWCTRQKWLGRSLDTGLSYKKLDIRMWRAYMGMLGRGIGQGSNF